MADTTTERERQRRELHEALHDDPGGLTHDIWKELGCTPIAPISHEEKWLIDQSMRIADDDEAAAFVMTKVWGRDRDGIPVKLWTLDNITEAPACVQEFIAQHPSAIPASYSVDPDATP